MKGLRSIILALIAGMLSLDVSPANAAQPDQQTTTSSIYSADFIRMIMSRCFDYQVTLQDRSRPQSGWIRATFYTGVMSAYRATSDTRYLEQATSWSEHFKYQPLGDYRFGNDQLAGQVYVELYELKGEKRMLTPTQKWFDRMMAEPRPGRVDLWWCDGLYMGPPALARVAAATNNRKYLRYLDFLYWDAHECLFDRNEHLFSRDITHLTSTTLNGRKLFWSRGNGWVVAGLARLIPYLPPDWPTRGKYVELFKELCEKLATLQGEDGLWRTALLDPETFPVGESSGSAFHTFAMAWGVNNNLLDRSRYLPVIRRGWQGLLRNINAEGRLGFVQKVGDAPGNVLYDQTHEYGVGALLLAGSEMLQLGAGVPD